MTSPGFDPSDPDTGKRLVAAGYRINRVEPRGGRTPAEMTELVRDAVAVIASSDPFTADVFAAAPHLRVIARLGVGFDAIDVRAATEAKVVVTTTPGLNADTVAEHTLTLLLACLRRITENDRVVRLGRWERGGDLSPHSLAGKRVGILGYGSIGQAVRKRLNGFDVEVKIYDPAAEAPQDEACETLEELLRWSQVVSIHTPLTADTKDLIGETELGVVNRGTILVNTARGGVVNESALIGALRDGRLAGAALDVFAQEPPTGSPLLDMPNVVLTPHIGGLSVETMHAMSSVCVQQVLDVLAGARPKGVVNPAVLERLAPATELPRS